MAKARKPRKPSLLPRLRKEQRAKIKTAKAHLRELERDLRSLGVKRRRTK